MPDKPATLENGLPDLGQFGIVSDIFNGKVVLTCQKHTFSYNPNKQATPGCKACHMVQHVGLLAAVPPKRREEILEDLEFSVHHMVEASNRGQVNPDALGRHPEVYKNDKRIG